ncbi:MAG TPA: NAD-dependent malic enzyme [Ktedonobacterales bacterium]|nr:NAD-dependent malic enzyme [Ktedonobacterales bacterium]
MITPAPMSAAEMFSATEPITEHVLDAEIPPQVILDTPLLNKGSAFPEEERRALGLLGLLPSHVSTIEEQLARTYENYSLKDDNLERYVFLAALQDRNEVLFYRLLQEHIEEMAPIIYTPVVGLACQRYSHIYRRPRGVYLSYPYQDDFDTILEQATRGREIAVVVMTDGERILGLGDLGIGGMGIPVGKLALYSLCAGIHPAATLPVVLDAGTDNPDLLADPLYLGWRHPRVRGEAYDAFVERAVHAIVHTSPRALLQWEDFAKGNARRLLEQYRTQVLSFNDDIQGTGAVTVAGLLAAVEATGTRLSAQRIVVLGAGSAATGIADQIVAAMAAEGSAAEAGRAALWLLDSHGLLHTGRDDLDAEKRQFAQPWERVAGWPRSAAGSGARWSLAEVVAQVRPTALIGTAAQPGAFDERVVREMARHVERPIIFPLSNPTDKSEATPEELLTWTDGHALVASGSPFPDVTYDGRRVRIGQCNNMFIFPGIGLGVIAGRARRVTDGMLLAAARALSARAPIRRVPDAPLYPGLDEVRAVARDVARAVAIAAQQDGVASMTTGDELERRLDTCTWAPRYVPLYRRRTPAGSLR